MCDISAVETVAHQHDVRPLGQHPPRPLVVEGSDALPDSGPPDQSCTAPDTFSIASSTSLRLSSRVMFVSRVPNTKTCNPVTVVHHRVQEVQKHSRVVRHGTGDVAKHNKRRLPEFAPFDLQMDEIAAAGNGGLQRAPEIDSLAVPYGLVAAGLHVSRCAAKHGDRTLRLDLLFDRHLLEVLLPQSFLVRKGVAPPRLRARPATLPALRMHLAETRSNRPSPDAGGRAAFASLRGPAC